MKNINFRKKQEKDNKWVIEIARKIWGSPQILSKDNMFDVDSLHGYIAEKSNSLIGVVLYHIDKKQCEIVAIYCKLEKQGIGTRLIELVTQEATEQQCKRVWLQTTNDNTQALRFYQRRKFYISAIRTDVIKEQRKVKYIPLKGNDDIPIRDEIELELKI